MIHASELLLDTMAPTYTNDRIPNRRYGCSDTSKFLNLHTGRGEEERKEERGGGEGGGEVEGEQEQSGVGKGERRVMRGMSEEKEREKSGGSHFPSLPLSLPPSLSAPPTLPNLAMLALMIH